MTDNEIKKALKCCSIRSEFLCFDKNCPLLDEGDCMTILSDNALGLINRQQAEIERLQKEKFDLKNGYFQKRYEESECKELQSLRKAWEKSRMDYIELNAEWEGKYISAKAEAIKECLDWVISLFPEDKNFTTISRFTVKQKLKEMVGG